MTISITDFCKLKQRIPEIEVPLSLQNFAYIEQKIQDPGYLQFLKMTNGGFFNGTALHLYGTNDELKYHSIIEINSKLAEYYGDLFPDNYYSFGQDIFGNQFIYFENSINRFMIETAELELIAPSFDELTKKILDNFNYFSGNPILAEWESKKGVLKCSSRLQPGIPFVMGGQFGLDNLYERDIDLIFSLNSIIARKIKDLPDGTLVEIGVDL